MEYELIDAESILDLIDYAGGLTSTASNKAILNNIIPMDKRISTILPNLDQSFICLHQPMCKSTMALK